MINYGRFDHSFRLGALAMAAADLSVSLVDVTVPGGPACSATWSQVLRSRRLDNYA